MKFLPGEYAIQRLKPYLKEYEVYIVSEMCSGMDERAVSF